MTKEAQTETQTTTEQVDPDFEALLGGEETTEESGQVAETQESDDQPKDGKEDQQAGQKEQEGAKAEKAEAPNASDELKRLRDALSQTRGAQKQLWRMAKNLEEDGMLDRDQIAEKMGMKRGEVDHLLDAKPGSTPNDPDYQQELFDTFSSEVKRPQTMKVLEKAYGGQDKLNELKNAFTFALNADPSVRDGLKSVMPDDIVAHVFETGAKYLEAFKSSNGGSLLDENKSLRARIKELEAEKEEKGGQPEGKVLNELKPVPVNLTPLQAHAQRLAG